MDGMGRWMDWLTFTPLSICNKWEYDWNMKMGWCMSKTLSLLSHSSALSSPAPVSLLTFSCLSPSLPCQQTFGILHLHINYELEESLFASLNHSTQSPLSCLFLCPLVTWAARGTLHVSQFSLYLSLSLTHPHTHTHKHTHTAFCVSIPPSWLLCVHVAPSPSLCEELYLVGGIKISSCKVEAQKRFSGQLTWTQRATFNPHLLHTNSCTVCQHQHIHKHTQCREVGKHRDFHLI